MQIKEGKLDVVLALNFSLPLEKCLKKELARFFGILNPTRPVYPHTKGRIDLMVKGNDITIMCRKESRRKKVTSDNVIHNLKFQSL